MQRNRESCLAAFMARTAVRLLLSHPLSSLMFSMTAARSPAVDLRRLTTLSVQSRQSTASPSKRCCMGMEGASALLQCAPLPSKPCSPSPFALFPPPFPLPKQILTFLVVFASLRMESGGKGPEQQICVSACLCAWREGRFPL